MEDGGGGMSSSSGQDNMPPMGPPAGRWNPRTVRVIAVVAAVVVVVSVVAGYEVFTRLSACTLKSTNPLIFDQAEKPDTLDPQVTFSTPGWGIIQQVYQTLVNYNGSDYTTFLPVLAKSWDVSPDRFNYTFHLRSGVHFSNGDPFNAYVMWYSLYRGLVMNQAPQFILSENFWYPGLNYSADSEATKAAVKTLTTALNTYDFSSPTPAQLAYMKRADQSFQVIDDLTIQLNQGNGYLGKVAYTFLLATLSSPLSSAIDPLVVKAQGGVTNSTNDWMATHMVGTGQYVLSNYNFATGYTLKSDPNYWGKAAAAAEPSNNMIQPAKASIEVDFQPQATLTAQDLKSGSVAGASFTYIGPSTVFDLKNSRCLTVTPLDTVYGSTAGAWWIYMNQTTPPFTDIHVRKAVVHAINYERMISVAFAGLAQRWVGPVPPGYQYYNPENLAPYQYNLALAKEEMKLSKWPNGYPNPINYLYINAGDWVEVASLLKDDLAQIGITINPVGISLDTLYIEQQKDTKTGECIAQTATNGGPFPLGQEFYTSDYISPDDWTQNNIISSGSANVCMAGYNNATADGLVLDAAGQSDPAVLRQDYAQMTRLMYDNYAVAWLVVPTQFQVTNPLLKGYVSNPMGAALPFVIAQNTMFASP